jgi:glyoxylase-like metal-dependent hydrolase (beta-lactamase superfamily II)
MVDGDSIEIIPGIRVFTGSLHTKGSQYLLVNSNTPTGKVLLASDASWFYYNLNNLLPIPVYTFDPVAYVAAMKRIKTLMPDGDYIIPGHDDTIFTKFPKVCEGVVRIDR